MTENEKKHRELVDTVLPDYPEPKAMIVHHWTKNTKYNCPDCGSKKSITYPNFRCSKCNQKFKIKVKIKSI